MMEMLDIFDEDMRPAGRATRTEAHARGLIHQVVHLWIATCFRGEPALIFQQRAADKQDFPGYYDIAVGGHVDAGETPKEAVLRECREEIGLHLRADELRYCGAFRDDIRIAGMDDREMAHVYFYRHPAPEFVLGPEVERMVWVPLEEYKKKQESPFAITAYTRQGDRIGIKADRWCRHPGEFERFILPVLEG